MLKYEKMRVIIEKSEGAADCGTFLSYKEVLIMKKENEKELEKETTESKENQPDIQWAKEAADELQDYIEEQGIQIRY